MFAARLPRKLTSPPAGLSFTTASNTSGTTTFYATVDSTESPPALQLSWALSGGTAPYTVKLFVGGVELLTVYTGSNTAGTVARAGYQLTSAYQGAVELRVTDSLGATATSGTIFTMLTYYFSGGTLYASPSIVYNTSTTSLIYWHGHTTNVTHFGGVIWGYSSPIVPYTQWASGDLQQTTGTFDHQGQWAFDSYVQLNGYTLRYGYVNVSVQI